MDYYSKYSARKGLHLLAPGSSNPKMKKMASELGIQAFALSLAPFDVGGLGNVCPFASPGCSGVCSNYAGRGAMSTIQKARIAKTRFWFSNRDGFLELLNRDLERVNRYKVSLASKRGKRAVVRLNVFSDIPWERFLNMEDFPEIQFYDYTKIAARLGNTPGNYYLTFSLSETNEDQARKALKQGFNIAVPVREKKSTFWDYPVIDGDLHDYRFLDPAGSVIVLKPKGLALQDSTGFVRED